MAEEQPLVMMVAWAVILWSLWRQASKTFRTVVLPGLQACGLQLLLLIACNAISPTLGRVRSHHHYSLQYQSVEHLMEGLVMLFGCVVLPRRVVSRCVPHWDLYRHYQRKLREQPLKAQTRNFTLVGLTDSEEHSDDDCMARSVEDRSRRALWYSRSAAVILVLVRPISMPLMLEQHWWRTQAAVDFVLLAIGTILTWAAGNELTKEILHVALPKYRHLAFIVCSMVWAFELQHFLCMSIGNQYNELLMMGVMHVGEVAFVVSMAGGLLDPEADPLVQIALGRRDLREAREAADDESSVSSSQSPRYRCCQLCRALLDVRRVVKDIVAVGLPWPLHLVKDSVKSDSDESDSEETSEVSKVPAEALAGREAWGAWASRTGVHPAWHGKRVPRLSRSKDSPCAVRVNSSMSIREEDMLSPEEKVELLRGGNWAVNKNSWWLVPADLFTDRVRSKFLAVVMVVILVVMTYSHDIFNEIIGRISNPVAALGVQLCLMAVLWILFGLLVLGNNAFVSYACHRRWIVVVGSICLGLAIYTGRMFFAKQVAFSGGGAVRIVDVFDDVEQRWADFSVGLLSFLGFFLSVHLWMAPEDSNDFHTCEFNALWYTSDLFQSAGKVADLRRQPPQRGEQLLYIGRSSEGEVKALVEKDNGDGTCDVVLADGRRLARERHKFFRRTSRQEEREEQSLDAELQRLKALRPASKDYPAVLYLGAISSIPLLTSMACGLLLAVRTVLHVVFRVHVWCSLLTFMLNGIVVPPGPAGHAADAVANLARDVFAWRLEGGTGLADAAHLPHIANATGLYYRYSNAPDSESLPCTELPQGKKITVLLAMGQMTDHFRLRGIEKGITHTLQVIWGVQRENVERVGEALEKLWDVVSEGDRDFRLDAAKAGVLLCEAKLLSSVRLKSAGNAVLTAAQGLAVSLAGNLTDTLEKSLETASWGSWPVVGHFRDQAVHWLQELQAVLVQFAEGGPVASAQLVDAVESGLQRSAPFLKAAAHLAQGGKPDAASIVQMLDKDGDGKLSIATEAPAVVDLGVQLCKRAGCGHVVESKIWEALAYADQDGDGSLSVEDLKHVGKALKESFRLGKRVVTGVCGTGGTVGVVAAAAGSAGAVAAAQRVPGFQDLLHAFDSNGDSALSFNEVMDPLNKMVAATGYKGFEATPGQAENLIERAGLGNVWAAFRKADVNKDGKLTLDEAALGGFGAAVAKLCPGGSSSVADDGVVGATAVTSRRLTVVEQPEDASDAEIVVNVFNIDFGQSFSVVNDLINVFANDIICLALVGVNWVLYLSVFSASICQLYVVGRCFSRYRTLFESMQSGRHDYVGHTSRASLEQGFAETTMFPGMLFGTTFFGFLFVSVLVFVLLIATAVACLPCWGDLWQQLYPVLIYLSLAFLLKEFIRSIVMDILLADEGEIIHPALFSLFWFIELFLNFVLGVSFAVFRCVLVLVWALVSCCFVDFTLMSEALVSWDSAYYSLLTMAYTHHVRRNPIKKAMLTTLFRHIQSTQQDEDGSGEGNCDGELPAKRPTSTASPALCRARARIWLALTLHHNPELRHLRRRLGHKYELGGPTPEQELARPSPSFPGSDAVAGQVVGPS